MRAGSGPVHVFRTQDETGLPIVFALDAAEPEAPSGAALTILDDSDAVLDTDEHKVRWRSWLYWSNLTQFLSLAGGDVVQLAISSAADFEVEVLAICGGLGELDSSSAPCSFGGNSRPCQRTSQACRSGSGPPLGRRGRPGPGAARRRRGTRTSGDTARADADRSPDLLLPCRDPGRPRQAGTDFRVRTRNEPLASRTRWRPPGIKIAVGARARQRDRRSSAARRRASQQTTGRVRTAAEWLAHLDELPRPTFPATEEARIR